MSGTKALSFRPLQDWVPHPGIRLRLTVDQFHGLMDAGEIPRDEPWELLDGQVVYKDRSKAGEEPMTVGILHSLVCSKLLQLNGALTAHGCFIRIQQPVTLPPYNELEPDGSITRGVPDDYVGGHPSAADLLCVIEVSDSSLRRDRTTKLEAYAISGVTMYVILDLTTSQAEVYTGPMRENGRYARSETLSGDDRLGLPTAGGDVIEVSLNDLFPRTAS